MSAFDPLQTLRQGEKRPACKGNLVVRWLLCAWLLLAGGCASAPEPAAVAADLAIVHVNVIDVASGKVLPDQTVLIEGQAIKLVAPSSRTSTGRAARVMDASGKFLIPGLWDMHIHSSSDRITRETYLPTYVAYGITGVRDTKGDCFDPCDELESSVEQVRQWRSDIAAGRLIGPRIVAGSALINGPRGGRPSTIHRPRTEAHARALVHLLKRRNVDFIKTYSMLPPEAYFALADEAKKEEMPVAGHVPFTVPVSAASDVGHRSIEHLWGMIEECSTSERELRPQLLRDLSGERPSFAAMVLMAERFSPEKCGKLYERLARNGTWLTPTLTIHDAILVPPLPKDPRYDFVHPKDRLWWENEIKRTSTHFPKGSKSVAAIQQRKMQILFGANAAGVGILAGSDAGFPDVFPGWSLHHELSLLVRAGLSPAEALRAATLNPAKFFGNLKMGTVAPGKVADLVLLAANPLTDIDNTRRIDAVVLNGRILDRGDLDRLLREVRESAQASSH